MAVAPKLEIKQSQSLLMTPQLRQAINLLQLNNIELNELVTQELESNPLLEREDDKLSEMQEVSSDEPQEETWIEDIDYDNAFDDAGSDRTGYEPSWLDYTSATGKNVTEDDFDYLEQRVKAEESVYDLLSRQTESVFIKNKDRLTASLLSTFLDGAGYFTGDLHKIAQQTKLDRAYLEKILQKLQTFEPSGIFARSLKECLAIQLQDQNRLDDMMKIFLDNLPLLAEGKIKTLKKICQADDDDIATMIADIKAQNPKPLAPWHKDGNSNIIPDVFVRQNKYGEYIVELNQDTLPKVLINHAYKTQISADKKTGKYIKERLRSANFLIRALHQRAETVLKISEQIVKFQRDFFEYGINHIKPLFLKDIAEAVEMHESTVSRVTNHKYMLTPVGLFELKYFFSAASGMYNGDTQTSVTSIKHKIKQLIENEGDKILSDDAIVECLAAQSVKIARRTVAKYRDEMGIPGSAQRKREHRRTTR